MPDTRGDDYARRLGTLSGARWKRVLNVQAPYRWNLRRQALGRTLDIGCGIGRNLPALDSGSVGVDHNPTSVGLARAAGHTAYTVDEWRTAPENQPGYFDGLLIAHVLEHLDEAEGEALVRDYLPALRSCGKVFLICPQERGYASDDTHVSWTTGADLEALARRVGLEPSPWRSFPFPRRFGGLFTYNEFNVLARKPA